MRALIGASRAEGESLADAIDLDLKAVGIDREKVRMQAAQDSPAAATARLRILARAEQTCGDAPRLSLELRRGRAGQQQCAGEALGRRRKPFERSFERRRHQSPYLPATMRQVCWNTVSASP